MAKSGVKMIGAWESFEKSLDPVAFKTRLDRNLLTAHRRMGRQFVRNSRRLIRAGSYAPNSPITTIIKGSSKPLVDKGDLFQSITFDADSRMVKVGLIRAKSSPSAVNLGITLHEGATIDVRKHPQVRKRVWATVRDRLSPAQMAALGTKSRRSAGRAAGKVGRKMTDRQRRAFFARQPKTSGSGKAIWRIPARPFLAKPLGEARFVRFVRDTWEDAVKISLFPPGQRTR